jgi:hypothetical protein
VAGFGRLHKDFGDFATYAFPAKNLPFLQTPRMRYPQVCLLAAEFGALSVEALTKHRTTAVKHLRLWSP